MYFEVENYADLRWDFVLDISVIDTEGYIWILSWID